MSFGYEGICRKQLEDEVMVVYSYTGENWNDEGKSRSGDDQLQDGMFSIMKRTVSDSIEECLAAGHIVIDRECKNAFRKGQQTSDYIALMLLRKVILFYEKNGVYPEREAFVQ